MTQYNPLGNLQIPLFKPLPKDADTFSCQHQTHYDTREHTRTTIPFSTFMVPKNLQDIGITHQTIQILYSTHASTIPLEKFNNIITILSSIEMDSFLHHRFTIKHLTTIIHGCLDKTAEILKAFLCNMTILYPLIQDPNKLGMFSHDNIATILSSATTAEHPVLNINSLRNKKAVPALKNLMVKCNLSTDTIAELLKRSSSPQAIMYQTLDAIIGHEEDVITFINHNPYDLQTVHNKLKSYHPKSSKRKAEKDDNPDAIIHKILKMIPEENQSSNDARYSKVTIDFTADDIPDEVAEAILRNPHVTYTTEEMLGLNSTAFFEFLANHTT